MLRALLPGLLLVASTAALADTTITYQGQLRHNGEPFEGTISATDITFEVFDHPDAGIQIAGPVNPPDDVLVSEGLFQVELDFGNVHDGGGWLQVTIEGNELLPRQRITPAPVAIRAINDADTTYSAGSGLTLSGTTFTLDTTVTDARYWNMGGDSDTNPANDFLGTTDTTPFEIHVGGERVLRLEPADVPNFIGGWIGNTVATDVIGATIGGGGCPDLDSFPCTDERANQVTANFATVGGGVGNAASGSGATIGGGWINHAGGDRATIGGGWINHADGDRATVGGGYNNTASGVGATIGGGWNHTASGSPYPTIGGGVDNTASGPNSTVGGGWDNIASGLLATVGGGRDNTASGDHSTVPGGLDNLAAGNFSFAAGRRAKAEDNGTFVWADSSDEDFTSTGADQFLIRAAGGVGINENDPESNLHIMGASPDVDAQAQLLVEGEETSGAEGTGAAIAFLGHDGNIRRRWGRIVNVKENDTVGDTRSRMSFYVRGGSGLPAERMRIESDGTTVNSTGNWATFSDRRLKHNIGAIDGPLQRLLQLRGTRFEFGDNDIGLASDTPRMGFIAQEVERVFPEWVRTDTSGYKQVSTIGFKALAVEALRELHSQAQSREEQIGRLQQRLVNLETENAELRALAAKNRELERRLSRMEALLVPEMQAVQASR